MKGCIKLRLAQPVAQTSNLLYRGFSNPPPKAQRLNLSSAWTEICPIWDIFLSREFGHSEAGILAGNSFFPGKFQVSNPRTAEKASLMGISPVCRLEVGLPAALRLAQAGDTAGGKPALVCPAGAVSIGMKGSRRGK